MTRPSIWLQRFDREKNFTVLRPFRHNGKFFERGQAFDTSLASTRGLRLLYESRMIRMEDEHAPVVANGHAPEPQENWRQGPWHKRRAHVARVTGVMPKSMAHAEELMKANDG